MSSHRDTFYSKVVAFCLLFLLIGVVIAFWIMLLFQALVAFLFLLEIFIYGAQYA